MNEKDVKYIIDFTVREMIKSISWIGGYDKLVNKAVDGIYTKIRPKL